MSLNLIFLQLGLTFTVPFLTIPLNSLQSMLGGGGIGDFFNFGDFDTSNLLIVGVIALAAIFILPQVIYWATGVNLSAFNWGRSEPLLHINRFCLWVWIGNIIHFRRCLCSHCNKPIHSLQARMEMASMSLP